MHSLLNMERNCAASDFVLRHLPVLIPGSSFVTHEIDNASTLIEAVASWACGPLALENDGIFFMLLVVLAPLTIFDVVWTNLLRRSVAQPHVYVF